VKENLKVPNFYLSDNWGIGAGWFLDKVVIESGKG